VLVELNVSNEQFLRIDSSEAMIHFPKPHIFVGKVHFESWGLEVNYSLTNSRVKRNPELPFEDDFVITGKSIVTLSDVYGGCFSVALYSNDGLSFVKDYKGNLIYLKEVWGREAIEDEQTYHFNGILVEPKGSLDLQLYSSGKVTIQFDTKDCVLLKEYVVNKEFYNKSKLK
jgi:hypothetical protein